MLFEPNPSQIIESLPDPIWTVLGWPAALWMVALCLHSINRRIRLPLLGPIMFLVGIGLAIFMFYAHAWPYDWSAAAWTIALLAFSIILLRRFFPWEFRMRLQTRSWAEILVLMLLVPVWAYGFHLYLRDTKIAQLPAENKVAAAYKADPSCSFSAMRRLAKEPAMLIPISENDKTTAACSVQWMQVEGKAGLSASGPACVDFRDAGTQARNGSMSRGGHHNYCFFSYWDFPWWAREEVHRGDLMVTQLARGSPSAFLRPPAAASDYFFYPRGQIMEAAENPYHFYREHVWRAFWAVFWFVFAGAALIVNILR